MGATEKTPSFKLCIEVREFITLTLSNVIEYLGQSLRFDLSVQCPKSDGYGIDCLIPVAILQKNVDVSCRMHVRKNDHTIISHEVLKFWFQKEESAGRVEGITDLLSEQGLSYVAARLGAEGILVALELNLTQAEIKRIQMDSPSDTLLQIRTALSTLLNKSKNNAHDNKVFQLLRAIEEVKRNDLVLELKEKYHVEDTFLN